MAQGSHCFWSIQEFLVLKIPKINVIPSSVFFVSLNYISMVAICTLRQELSVVWVLGCSVSQQCLVTRSKVTTLRRSTLEQMPVSSVLWKCIADALLPSAAKNTTWFLSLVSIWCMYFSLPYSLLFHYFPLFPCSSHSHTIYLAMPLKTSVCGNGIGASTS